MIDVVCTQSYTDNKIFNVGAKIGTGQASIQAGTCEYQGKTYLALSVGSDSTMTLFFTGLHSGDSLLEGGLPSLIGGLIIWLCFLLA